MNMIQAFRGPLNGIVRGHSVRGNRNILYYYIILKKSICHSRLNNAVIACGVYLTLLFAISLKVKEKKICGQRANGNSVCSVVYFDNTSFAKCLFEANKPLTVACWYFHCSIQRLVGREMLSVSVLSASVDLTFYVPKVPIFSVLKFLLVSSRGKSNCQHLLWFLC